MIERAQWYTLKLSNPSLIDGFNQQNISLQTDSDAPFRCFGIAFYAFDSSGNPLAAAGNVEFIFRLTQPDGTTYFQRHQIPGQAIQPFQAGAPTGAASLTAPYFSYFAPISPNKLYRPQSTFTVEFTNLPFLASSRVYIVFCGTKIYREGAIWAPTYPAHYRTLPFDYATQIPINALPIRQQPFPSLKFLNADSGFVWQRGAQTDQPPAALAPVGAAKGLGVILYDPQQKAYSNDFVPLELIFGFDNSQTPGLVYPEIYIPRQQQLYLDIAQL